MLEIERGRSKVLKTLVTVNAEYHRIKAMELEAKERKALLLKDLDRYDSDLILLQNAEGDLNLQQLESRRQRKGSEGKKLKCTDPVTCKRELDRVSLGLRTPRIFVYDLPRRFNKELSRKYKRCTTDQYGTEVSAEAETKGKHRPPI